MKRCLMVTGGPLDLPFGRRFLLGRTYELVLAVDAGLAACEALGPVSYTHLTLPTIA